MSIITNVESLNAVVQAAIGARDFFKCAICLETAQKVVKINCKHVFCSECLKSHENLNSKNYKAVCPVCRATVKRRKKYDNFRVSALTTFINELDVKLKNTIDSDILGLGSMELINKKIKSTSTIPLKSAKPPQPSTSKLFDSLINNSRPITKKVYGCSKKKIKLIEHEPSHILNFDHNDNRNYVLQWLNDNKNKFDRLTQTQNYNSEPLGLESVSQNDKPDVQKSKLSSRSSKRTRSLECINISQKKAKSRCRSVCGEMIEKIEQFSSDNSAINIPNTAEKVAIVDLMEDHILKSFESEVAKQMKSKKIINKSKKSDTSTLTNGWKRMKEMKRSIKKRERRPKKLNISRSRSTSSSASDTNKAACKEVLLNILEKKKVAKNSKDILQGKKNYKDPLEFSSTSSDEFIKSLIKKSDIENTKEIVTNKKSDIENTKEIVTNEKDKSVKSQCETGMNKTVINKEMNCDLNKTDESVFEESKTKIVHAQVHAQNKKKCSDVKRTISNKRVSKIKQKTKDDIEEDNKIVVDVDFMENYFQENMRTITKNTSDPDSDVSQNHIKRSRLEQPENVRKSNENSEKPTNSDALSNQIQNNKYQEDEDENEIFLKPTQDMFNKNVSAVDKVLSVPVKSSVSLEDKIHLSYEIITNVENVISNCKNNCKIGNQTKIINEGLNDLVAHLSKLKSTFQDIEKESKRFYSKKNNTNCDDFLKNVLDYENSKTCSTRTVTAVDNQDQAVQTETFSSPRGIRVSSNEIFVTINKTDVEVQTDNFYCLKCRNITNELKTTIKSSSELTNDALERTTSDILARNVVADQILTDSFDNMQFETQNAIIKTKEKQTINEALKVITPRTVEINNKINDNTQTQTTTRTKDTTALIIDLHAHDTSTENKRISRQLVFSKDEPKQSFKRIRQVSDNDSDLDIPNEAKKICSKYLMDDLQLSIQFETQTQPLPPPPPLLHINKSQDVRLLERNEIVNTRDHLVPSIDKRNEPSETKKKFQTNSQEMHEKCMKALMNAEKHSSSVKNICKPNVVEDKNLALSPNVVQAFENENEAFTCEMLDRNISKFVSLSPSAKNEFLNNNDFVKINGETRHQDVMNMDEGMFDDNEQFENLVKNHATIGDGKVDDVLRGLNSVSNQKIELSSKKIKHSGAVACNSKEQCVGTLSESMFVASENVNRKNAELSQIKTQYSTSLYTHSENYIKSIKYEIQNKLDKNLVRNRPKEIALKEKEVNDAFMRDDFFMDGIKPLTPKVNILQNITIHDFKDDDKENLENSQISEGLSDVDFVDTTPQKIETFRSKRSQQQTTPVTIPSSPHQLTNYLNITLPPPEEFQDTEAVNDKTMKNTIITVDDNDSDITLCERNMLPACTPIQKQPREIEASTPFSQVQLITQSLSLSPIARDKERPVLSLKMDTAMSPLSIVVKTPSSKRQLLSNTSTPRQQSILNYSKPTVSVNKKPCIACTRLSKEQVIAISSLTNKKLATYSTNFGSSVTHMIVDVNEKNCIKDHTMKFVLAVAAGIWVLNFKWIQDCLQQNRIIPEEPYEVLDVSGIPGPKESRLNRLIKPLFENFRVHVAPPFAFTTRIDNENIIKLLGGRVVSKLDDLKEKNGEVCLIVTEARNTQNFEIYEDWLEKFRVVTVDIEWLSRSVGQYKLLSVRPFALCSDDISGLGYPPEMLVEAVFSFSQSTYSTV